ncbi:MULTISPECIES: hypothetical protein [unclassified Microcoleus]
MGAKVGRNDGEFDGAQINSGASTRSTLADSVGDGAIDFSIAEIAAHF